MAAAPEPVKTSAMTAWEPNAEAFVPSGCDTSSPITTDWYLHTQSLRVMYIRKDHWTECDGRAGEAPYSDFNYIDARCEVRTTDNILYNATFSSCAQTKQELFLLANGDCSGGFGLSGVVDTCVVGVLRRPARKDAQGNILDKVGDCGQVFNIDIDKAPGAYACSTNGFDTSATRNSGIGSIVAVCPAYCSKFRTNLVDL